MAGRDGDSKERPVAWGSFTPEFVDELANWIGDRRVLEVFAGNGLLASMLSARGIDIIATSLFSGHDGHTSGMQHPVEEIEAAAAVGAHGMNRDILLMSWPTTSEAATKAALFWGEDRPIVFIGEVTDYSRGFGGLGGCASDLFFEITYETSRFDSYEPRSGLDRAGIRALDLEAVHVRLPGLKRSPVP